MKEQYKAPEVITDSVFETLALGCTFADLADPNCNPDVSPVATQFNS